MSDHLPEDVTPQPGSDDLDEHQVRQRAWEISQRPDAGTSEENWRRAEEELRQEQDQGGEAA